MIIAEPLNASYRLGVPFLGKNVTKVADSLATLELVGKYRRIRTMGSSAGAYPALMAGQYLNADMIICLGGRFPHKGQHPFRYLNRLVTIWRALRKGKCSSVLLSYATDNSRDRKYARFIARFFGGTLLAMEYPDQKIGHRLLEVLLNRGELSSYLKQTIFAEAGNGSLGAEEINKVNDLSGDEVRSQGSVT